MNFEDLRVALKKHADEKTKLVCDGLSDAEDVIIGLPSANLARTWQDCISRQDAIDALTEDEYGEFWDCIDSSIAADIIRRLPSARPEIIYCKDCKYAEYIDDVKTLWCTECGQGRTVAPYDFCSYAERRE